MIHTNINNKIYQVILFYKKISILFLLILLIFIVSKTVGATTYYVSTTGNDTNNGSIEHPFGTINHALSFAYPGDIVYLRAGDYRIAEGEGTINFPRNGTADNPIRLGGYNDEDVNIIGSIQLTEWSQYSGNIYRRSAPGIDIEGLFEDGQRLIHPLYYENGNRVHPPISYIDSSGKWTIQDNYVYLWAFNNDNPESHDVQASQVKGIVASKNYLVIENLNILYTQRTGADAGGGISISGDNVIVNNCIVGKNSCGNGNAYAVYFYGSSNCVLSNSTIFDSHYWGGDGADQNSHVVSLINSGDSGAVIIENNEIFNEGGLGVGSKGANINTIVRGNYIHGTAAGVRITGARVSGPGAGKTDRGHYRIYRNILENNTNGVRISGDSTTDDRVYNNIFINNERAVSIRDYDQSIYDTQIINNIFLNNSYAIHLIEKLYGENNHYNEETFQYFKDRGLISHNNLFFENGMDWANQINDWGNPTIINKTYQEIYYYNELGWEENSLGENPSLDSIYYPMEGSPVIDAGYDMGLSYNGLAPDIGVYEYLQEGINDKKEIIAYPNPCRMYLGQYYITFGNLNVGNIIKIYDINGRLVHNSGNITDNNYKWSVNNVSSGIYFYKVKSDNKASGKIVIIR